MILLPLFYSNITTIVKSCSLMQRTMFLKEKHMYEKLKTLTKTIDEYYDEIDEGNIKIFFMTLWMMIVIMHFKKKGIFYLGLINIYVYIFYP